ncbi:hypothetical protein [Leptolyngbya sp. BC1307]|uniref:hypothetical protein n=1 Tax=Leptolyngbya sp. BC1307 TaxID=2029589 RepID=UPI000EFAD001|nr:hypothetical protein [Leptolyngbya sp. BC1307]
MAAIIPHLMAIAEQLRLAIVSTAHLWIPIVMALIGLKLTGQRCFRQRWGRRIKWLPHPKNRIGTLLYFHGADLNIGFNVAQAFWLRQLGFSVLLAEYRGYGLS